MGMGTDIRNRIAKRAAKEIKNGMVVNLGIGIPSLIPDHLPDDIHVMFHAENGIVGMGPSPQKGLEDENLCNAGGFPVSIIPGASYCDSAVAFGMIRKGRIDMTVLGALQVSSQGDLSNWIVPGKKVPGMGGAMDLAQKAKKVIVVMNHTDKNGQPKIVETCTLPLTSRQCIDLIITEMAVFQVEKEHLLLTEVFSPFTIDDVRRHTGCLFKISEQLIQF
ncbi:CoA-transferase, beta subunit [Bacillus methanolicus PB1]|uniref:CoA-transferase, beta subunit n=1 Tax=Bacillus methanolicus PB1 TaxID=997296 RepID=I3DWC6_BACMT|nr:3-oxoacid CoA-transferase subunit B [Bacillus methanolicus]EIJ78547.1 CoA-transferase, beta subunit [Bacillus methanolicus PB1]